MTIATKLVDLGNEITCSVAGALEGQGYIYYGTNIGDVFKYDIYSGARTKLTNLGGKIVSMALYSARLYCGLDSGDFVKVNTV